jgi:WD40 repeat protein
MFKATTIIILLCCCVFYVGAQNIPPEAGIWDAEWNPDNTLLAVANPGGQVYIYDVNGDLVQSLAGHDLRTVAVTWSLSSEIIVSSGWDGFIRFWDVETGNLLQEIDVPWGGVHVLDWQPNGAYLATSGLDTVQVWDTTTYRPVTIGAGASLLDIEWHPDGSSFTFGSINTPGIARIDDDQFDTMRFTINGEVPDMRTSSVSWNSDGTQVISTHEREGIYIWDAGTGEAIRLLFQNDETFQDAAFIGEGDVNVTALTTEGSIYTLDASTGEVLEVSQADAFLWTLSWNPQEELLAIGGTNNLLEALSNDDTRNIETSGFLTIRPAETRETESDQ